MKRPLAVTAAAAGFALALMPTAAQADDDRPIALVRCDQSMGSVAVVEGDARSWVDKGLGSPVAVIEALARESGCFTPFDINSESPADYIFTIVAGDQVEVASATALSSDRMATAAALAQNSGYRSGFGTAGDVAGMIPLAGAAINGLAGLVGIGRTRTVATGLTLIEAVSGTPLVAGTGQVQETELKFHDDDDDAMALMPEGYWMQGVEAASRDLRYTRKGYGREMVHGFVEAYNNLVAQARAMGLRNPAVEAAALAEAEAAAQAEAAAIEMIDLPPSEAAPHLVSEQQGPLPVMVAVEAALYLEPTREAQVVRSVRPGVELMPMGPLEGIFMPVSDPYGVLGWISVEDLQ